MDKYVCVHGHFYQPPMENPWLEDVELQDSAYPHHDWNARITEECYRQNAASRILGSDRKIIDIVNNYANISFNFGPTLLYWLESHAPDVYEKILEADKKARERFSGHGGAIAQAYNHMILPLSNDRDKHTQALWGIRDFQQRFQRDPEGMWLPETAVDIPTLEVLAEYGISFTILAPRQAKRVRPTGGRRWKNVNENDLDTTLPSLCKLPSGQQIILFFYHGPTAHDIAYGGLLHSGENLAARLMDSLPNTTEQARLIHVATDGESFGHHHRHGDMALAYCLHHLEANNLAEDARRLALDLDTQKLRFVGGHKVSRLMDRFEQSLDDLDLLQTIGKTLEILKTVISDIDLQNAQNIFFAVAKSRYPEVEGRAQSGDEAAAKWVAEFKNLAQQLGLIVP